MGNFLVMTKNGTTPPKYQHREIELAVAEAQRLQRLYKTDVFILEIVGQVTEVEVPVTRIESKVILEDRLQGNGLPF